MISFLAAFHVRALALDVPVPLAVEFADTSFLPGGT